MRRRFFIVMGEMGLRDQKLADVCSKCEERVHHRIGKLLDQGSKKASSPRRYSHCRGDFESVGRRRRRPQALNYPMDLPRYLAVGMTSS